MKSFISLTTAPATNFSVAESDTVFVSVTVVGRQVMTATISGKSSVEELMAGLRAELSGFDGLLTVNLRNSSQGTVAKRVLRVRKPQCGLLRAQMQGYVA